MFLLGESRLVLNFMLTPLFCDNFQLAEMVCKSLIENVPYFNGEVYLENKTQIGKIEEVFGPINEVMFSVKPSQGIVADS